MLRNAVALSLVALQAHAIISSVSNAGANKGSRMCYGSSDASCNLLFHDCASSASLWSSPSCLAAATCSGLEHFFDALCCTTGHCLDPAKEPNLDYKLYASIVGTCTQGQGGCPMTTKDYIKFYYNTLIDAGSFKLPPVKTVMGWWQAITSWSGGKGSDCPYTHLNSWLHHSIPPVHSQQAHSIEAVSGSQALHATSASAQQHFAAQPTHSGSADGHDVPGYDQDLMKHQMVAPHGNDTSHALARRASSSAASSSAATSAPASASASAMPKYELPCNDVPEVCENWCYYVFCKKQGRDANDPNWIVTVDRTINLRPQSQCGLKPNKCSTRKPKGDWPKNPVSGLSCDEQPKNSNREGGQDAATRCIPDSENKREGAFWKNWINKKDARIADGTQVKVVLESAPPGKFCASLHQAGSTVCLAPVTPQDKNVKDGTDDGRRQQ